jgi:hypothetical protein
MGVFVNLTLESFDELCDSLKTKCLISVCVKRSDRRLEFYDLAKVLHPSFSRGALFLVEAKLADLKCSEGLAYAKNECLSIADENFEYELLKLVNT